MGELLTIYLWALLLSSLIAATFLATRVTDEQWRIRLASYLAVYNLACLVVRMVMPTPELGAALHWLNPLPGWTFRLIVPIDRAVHAAIPGVRVAVRATATLVGSTAMAAALGWALGKLLDDQMGDKEERA